MRDAQPNGSAGGSARREYERRKAKRELAVRTRHPRIGGALLAVSGEQRSTTEWETGAVGEELVGARLDALAGPDLAVLHDRRIPRSRANLDHLVVTAAGVWVVDTKRYRGQRPALKVEGGLIRPRVGKLLVGGRDRTKLVDGVLRQAALVEAALGDGTPVRAALCFVDADFPVFGGPFEVRGVRVLWRKRLAKELATATGPVVVPEVAAALAAAFPPA